MRIGMIGILPIAIGYLLDRILGDPYQLPHPIRLIGRMITFLESKLCKAFGKKEKEAGRLLVVLTLFIVTVVTWSVLAFAYYLNLGLGICTEAVLCYYLLAAKCLKKESMKVYDAIAGQDILKARQAVAMIVGRDTGQLNEQGVIKAAVETVAENTSDGVTAPLMYTLLGGATFGFIYKAVNTMDSMIGYKNEKYINLGRCAARLDDFLNFLPSRITAVAMILAARRLRYDATGAYRIWKRDRRKHASPNSAQTEAVCAGALQIKLAGDASYSGKVCKKETIGDDIRKIENEDIRRANRLMYLTENIVLFIGLALRMSVMWIVGSFL